ncbi:MAG: M15 family metallopeptidase [Desulfobulbus sp.]|nr:M15 family metallopeptidase [Desulfobulbus sp.]
MIHYTVFQTLQVGFAANRLKALPVARMEMKRILSLFVMLGCLSVLLTLGAAQSSTLPEGFVYADQVIPDIKIDLRYTTKHNFVGTPIDGYLHSRFILTDKAAHALKEVQDELRPFGLSLKVFDGYRPQRAVDHFVRWAKDVNDTRMKREFYPDVKKENLFKEDYIAAKSSHSRGSTVDLTLTSSTATPSGPDLDMGSEFDLFAPKSWPTSLKISTEARAHRMLLQLLMRKHGFEPYPKEWWHFTFKGEPFPDTYFDFPVQ